MPNSKYNLGPATVLVAELGINHNGSRELALAEIRAAKASGADAVKVQNYRTEEFLADNSAIYRYKVQGKEIVESQFEMFKRCELSKDDLYQLKKCCDEEKIKFFSTPSSLEGLKILEDLEVPWLKNGSDYLTHLPLIQAMARSGIPTILSTGMATLAEIDDAVRAYREAGGEKLILMHCTSAYPTPPEDVNLRRINTLRQAFGCPVGLSEHTRGITAAIGSVAFGVCMIEKHFTLDKNLSGPDHAFSADPAEFALLAESVRTMEKQLGSAAIAPTASASYGRNNARLSCVAACDLPAGHCIDEADIAFQRPGSGLLPKLSPFILGRRLTAPIPKGHVFALEDFA